MTRRLLDDNRGVCLAELMIALTAGAVVLAAAVQSLTHFERRLSAQQVGMGRHQDLRVGLSVIEDELRLADAGSSGTFLLTANRQEVAFLANLEGGTAILTEAAHPGPWTLGEATKPIPMGPERSLDSSRLQQSDPKDA